MKITKQARRDAKQMFRNCLVAGQLDNPRVRQTVAAVAARKPRGYFGILSHFQRLVRLEIERRRARIESPGALSPELQADVKARLGAIYPAGLEYEFVQNPALLGGLRIQVGSDVYDGSVDARLRALEASFK